MSKTEIGAAPALMSLDDLDAVALSGRVHKFPYNHPKKGTACGVVLYVIGEEAESVQAFLNGAVDDQRRADALRATNAAEAAIQSGKRPEPTIRPFSEDLEHMDRNAAVRLVGWEGIAEPWSPENAYRLVSRNESVRKQVMAESQKLANFM